MGTKSFFTKQKSQKPSLRGQEKSTTQGITSSVESVDYIKEYERDKINFLPELDFSDPAKFVKYGSAKDYYADLVSKVASSYPYDGSLTERLKFKNELVAIQRYEFDNNYPRSTGYADFSDSTYNEIKNSFTVDTITFALGESSTPHYILTDNYSKNLVYNTASSQVGSIELDFSEGVTFEFWMKKAAFPAPAQTQNEVVFSISNEQKDLFQITTDVAASSNLIACFAQAATDANLPQFVYEFDTDLDTIADSSWHHYAMAFSTNSAGYVGEFYVDGYFQEKQYYTKASPFLVLTGTLDATIAASSLSSLIGDGKLSGSLDEIRLWKTRRDSKQIGENYFFDVGGGGNTDKTKVNKYNPLDLSLYYKFNEGITGTSSLDSIVLDYSGRLTDGVWVGYASGSSRQTGSAITLSEVATEVGSPIIYGSHSDVLSYKSEKETSGSAYDASNISSMYDMLPQWISDEDSENGLLIRKLIQIMSSYLDTLHAQITAVSTLQDGSYVSGSSAKPNPFSKRNLLSYGFEIPDVFIDPGVIEEIYFKDEKRLYEDKLFNLKNLIFQNIFNNLNFLNKTKGTEKAFRNLFRCFGVDDELVRLNMYSDNQEYEFREGFESAQSKRNVVDFSGYNESQNREGVIYTFADTTKVLGETGDYGYIPSASNLYIPLTIENQIYFPKFVDFPNGHVVSRLPRASLFGVHSASAITGITEIPSPDSYFKVYADTNLNNKTKFVLETNITSVGTLTSSYYEDVYNNNAWTFAVRVKPREYPFADKVTGSSNFDFEFYGVNYSSGIKVHEFSASAEVSTASAAGDISSFLTGSNKRLYVGADRTNITGAINYQTNVRALSSRVWFDYLKTGELQSHAKDVETFGRLNPYENSFIFEAGVSGNYIPKIETLALHWDFENITGSDSSGKFTIQDTTSGSSTTVYNKYGAENYYNLSGRNYSGQGFGFPASSTDVVDFLFVDTARQQLPENLYNSDLIEVREQDDVLFTKESRPSKYYFAAEISLYDTISRNILGFFASIEDFNNLVGEPVNMYRPNYKSVEKLRALFFENIQNSPDLEKYVNLYKWVDGALDSVLANMIPASAKVSDKVRSVVESHLLERSKYRHKYLHVKQYSKEDEIKSTNFWWPNLPEVADVDPTFTPRDFPTTTTIDAPPLRNLGNMENIVPEEIRKRKVSLKKTGLRPIRPAGPDPSPIESLRSPPNPSGDPLPGEQSSNEFWWRSRARRNPDGVLATGDPGKDRTRVAIQISQFPNPSASSNSPLSFDMTVEKSISTNTGYSGENRKNYFPSSFKLGISITTSEGLTISQSAMPDNNKGQPYYDYSSGTIDETYGGKRRVPLKITDAGNSIVLTNQKYLPFDVLSASSANSRYQDVLFAQEISASIETAHRDFVIEGTPIQSPWAEENVGGWMYRHGNRFVTSTLDRKEGYALSVEGNQITLNNPRLFRGDFQTEVPIGYYLRDTPAKSAVNIKNISGSNANAGNYLRDYEIIQTTGRKENNRYYVKSEGNTGSVSAATGGILFRTGDDDGPDGLGTYAYKDFEVLDRATGSNDFVIVSRFSAPGGPEVASFSFLDVEAAEYSVYNNLNYRNLGVRLANRSLLSRHTLSGGYDSVILEPSASYYKPQRNGIYHITGTAAQWPTPIWDNSYVGYGIPRTDVQYSWVKDSWVLQKRGYPNLRRLGALQMFTGSKWTGGKGQYDLSDISSPIFAPIYGFEYSSYLYTSSYGSERNDFPSGVVYVSGSEATYTLSTQVTAPVSLASTNVFNPFNGMNLVVFGSVDLENNLFTTGTVDYAGSALSAGEYFQFNASVFGPGDPWPQSAYNVLNAFLLNNGGPYRHASFKQTRGGDHRVARVFRKKNLYRNSLDVLRDDKEALIRAGQRYTITQSAVTSKFKSVLQYIDDVTGTIEYSFGNLYDYFAKTYNTTQDVIEDLNQEMGAPQVDIYDSDFYKFSKKFNTIRYKEVVYPREENEYRDLARNRENYVSFWSNDALSERTAASVVNSQGVTIDASRWLMDVSLSGSSYHAEKSGEIMRYTGSVGATAESRANKSARYSFFMGECRPNNLVQAQASSSAFYTSYGAFSTDVRIIGQDETIIPEFTVSDYVGPIVKNHNYDFAEKSIYAFSLTGSKTMTSASFLETYGKTENLTYLKELKEFYGEPTAIRLTFDVTKKLLPKDGFYPVQRTRQLASQFSSSYSNSSLIDDVGEESAVPAGTQATYSTTLMPFWAPGVGYNSIKAGFAVEFPYKATAAGPISASIVGMFDSAAPFESILAPSEYASTIYHIVDSGSNAYPHASFGDQIDSTGSVNKTDGVYELMAHNFFAEIPEFFLDGLATFKSSPQSGWDFRGPFSGSATGIPTHKKFAMDIVIENPANYLQYGQPAAYGPYPYLNHAPPGCYSQQIGSLGPGCPNVANIQGLGPNNSRAAFTKATLVFDTADFLTTDSRAGTTSFTLKDIIANSTITHVHQQGDYGSEVVFMTNTASLDLFNIDKDNRWVIKSKWECPTLQFSGTDVVSFGTPPDSELQTTRGMWHQYGSLAGSNDRARVHVRLEETSYEDSSLTGSLLEAVGFAPEAHAFGRIKNQKTLEEAICVVPFYIDCETGEEKFFEIPINIFENRYSQVRTDQITKDSISDMIRKMDKYVVPPPYDYVATRDDSRKVLSTKVDFAQAGVEAPFSMYFFEFSSKLSQQDLADVWQGVMPSIATTADKETVILEHPIVDGELLSPSIFSYNNFNSIPDNIRWKIFKVKKRASYDYYKMVEKQTGVATYKRSRSDRFSFNWPYDYCSLVELGKMEVEFEVQNDSPNRIRDIRGGGYITPEEAGRASINLGVPLTISRKSEEPIGPMETTRARECPHGFFEFGGKCMPIVDIPAPTVRCNDPVAINYLQPEPCQYREPDEPPPFTSPTGTGTTATGTTGTSTTATGTTATSTTGTGTTGTGTTDTSTTDTSTTGTGTTDTSTTATGTTDTSTTATGTTDTSTTGTSTTDTSTTDTGTY